MENLRIPAAGTLVEARGGTWSISRIDPGEACAIVTLHGLDDGNTGETARLLTPFDRLRPARTVHPRIASRRHALEAAARAVALARPAGGLWTAGTARMQLFAWQLEPALAVVGGAARVLLADHVGLGKTVEAGLIIAELATRGLAARTLVLTPPGLVTQWTGELRSRFGLDAVAIDQASLLSASRGLPPATSPWDLFGCVVTSIDLAKRPEVRAAMDGTPFDLLVVDEAHHARPGTDRGAVVAALAARTPFVVLATATPHDGNDDAYRFLVSLGDVGDDAPMTVFRRRRADVAPARSSARREHRLAVHASVAEQRLGDGLREYGRAVLGSGDRPAGQLVAAILERRAASSAAAAARTLARRRALVAGDSAPHDHQPGLPWCEDETRDDVEGDDVLGISGVVGREADLAALDRLSALAGAASSAASKARRLLRLLARAREPAVVFSEYRDTIDDLAIRLGSACSFAVVHGGLSPVERREAIEAFTSGRARHLLATDAAGEGLNLQATCRLVVNVEPPWSPLRLDQRVGRVDRIGQRRDVHAVHLVQPGSIEDTVCGRLERRRARIEAAGGATGPEPGTADAERARLARGRRLVTAADHPAVAGSAPLIACLSPRRRPAEFVALVVLVVVDATGRLLAREVAGIRLTAARRTPESRGTLLRALGRLPHDPRLLDVVGTAGDLAAVAEVTRSGAARLTPRLARIAADADRELGDTGRPLQVSLFDRRAERAWHLDRTRLQARAARARALMAALDDSRRPRVLTPRLVAAWTREAGI